MKNKRFTLIGLAIIAIIAIIASLLTHGFTRTADCEAKGGCILGMLAV